MAKAAQFQELTDTRLNEAKALHDAGFHQGAYYLAGYAVEFALKAAVCARLEQDNVFESPAEVYKGFKTHRFDQLILIAGLSARLTQDGVTNTELQLASNLFIVAPDKTAVNQWQMWSESQRYNAATCDGPTTAVFINHVDTFVTWLKTHWRTDWEEN